MIEEVTEQQGLGNPISTFAIAIAYHLIGQRDDARTWLDLAHRQLEGWSSPFANPRVQVEVLRHEAERLILGEPAVNGAAKSD